MTTTITGIRLQDEIGDDFLVISVPWECLATPKAAAETIMAFSDFDFPYILASCPPDGRWIYAGPGKLTVISETRLGQNPKWQEIPVSPPIESERKSLTA